MNAASRLGLFWGFLFAACSGQTQSACPEGDETCACYGNHTCNDGLQCLSNLCVTFGVGGATGTGGGANMGGGSGAGGAAGTGGGALFSSGGVMVGSGGSGGYPVTTGGATSVVLTPEYCNGLFAGQVCSQTNVLSNVQAVNTLLLVDESGSLRDAPDLVSSSSKWSLLRLSLANVLPTYSERAAFGLELFPYTPGGVNVSSTVSSCDQAAGAVIVPIAMGAAATTAVIDTLGAQSPAGGTPTAKALEQAYQYFTQGAGAELAGSRSIVLLTDGGPNCNSSIMCDADTCTLDIDGNCGTTSTVNCCDTSTTSGAANNVNLFCLDDTSTISQLSQLRALGVSTFVVGLPGSEGYASVLNAMANAGGVPVTGSSTGNSYYSVSGANFAADTQSALQTIFSQLTQSCDIALRATPVNPSTVAAVMNCQFVPMISAPSTSGTTLSGFYVDYSRSPAHLILTGDYCAQAMANPSIQLDVIDSCTLPVP